MKGYRLANASGLIIGLLASSGLVWAAPVEEAQSTAEQQQALALTIYNNDLALVKDTRRLPVRRGENRLAWRDVSARIQPETALLRSLDGRPVSLIEQNFDFNLLTPAALLEKSVGDTVQAIRSHPTTGAETVEPATVLAANNGVVLKYRDRIETGMPGRLAFAGVPANLRDKPTLGMVFEAAQGGEQTLELSYLSGGLSWRADYVAELNAGEDRLDLNGWVTLTNASGTAYRNAALQLVAGDVNRVRPEVVRFRADAAMPMVSARAQEMQEEGLFEYHLYTLARPTTLLDRQTKQVSLLTAGKVPVRKEYRLQGHEYHYQDVYRDAARKLKPAVTVSFENRGGDLGLPLPKGIVRVYKRDGAGRAQFIGEDRIEHTAKHETVRLNLGEAFDITAERKQTDFQKLAGAKRETVTESAWQLEIRNAKAEPVTVTVVEAMPGDWQVLSESLAHRKEAAHTALWQVPVPAEGKTVLSWRVRSRF